MIVICCRCYLYLANALRFTAHAHLSGIFQSKHSLFQGRIVVDVESNFDTLRWKYEQDSECVRNISCYPPLKIPLSNCNLDNPESKRK